MGPKKKAAAEPEPLVESKPTVVSDDDKWVILVSYCEGSSGSNGGGNCCCIYVYMHLLIGRYKDKWISYRKCND